MARYPLLLLLPVLALAACNRAPDAASGNQADNYAARADELEAAANNVANDAAAKLATEDVAPASNTATPSPPDTNQAITPVDGH